MKRGQSWKISNYVNARAKTQIHRHFVKFAQVRRANVSNPKFQTQGLRVSQNGKKVGIEKRERKGIEKELKRQKKAKRGASAAASVAIQYLVY